MRRALGTALTVSLFATVAACSDEPSDPPAGDTTCGVDSALFTEALGTDHYTVNESDTVLPLQQDHLGDRYECEVTIEDERAAYLQGDYDPEAAKTELADIQDAQVTFTYAGGKAGMWTDDEATDGLYRCKNTRVVVGIERPDELETVDELIRLMADRTGCL